MKTTTKAKTKTKVANDDSLIIPFRSVNQIIDDFAAAAKKKAGDSQDSTSFDNLVLIAKRLADLYADTTWSFQEFLTLATVLDLSLEVQQDFFARLIKALKAGGRCKAIESIYDYQLYQFI